MAVPLPRTRKAQPSLCVSPAALIPTRSHVAYSHLIEPRFDELKTEAEKRAELKAGSVEEEITSAPFRAALGATPVIAAGGFGPENLQVS